MPNDADWREIAKSFDMDLNRRTLIAIRKTIDNNLLPDALKVAMIDLLLAVAGFPPEDADEQS